MKKTTADKIGITARTQKPVGNKKENLKVVKRKTIILTVGEYRKKLKQIKEKGRQQGMVQGICLALADIARGYSIKDSWDGAGLSIKECEKNKVEPYDLDTIKKQIS